MSDPLAEHDFELDRFQIEAIEAFDAGESVLVAAPTGSGKTVIAEHGIATTLAQGRSTFYTSPIKALANQKYRDFADRFGTGQVGLLTGDLTVNGGAPIVVMTTEVLRNMLYEGSHRLRTLGCVVLDEVHYLQDRERGPVWEEVLLNLPVDVRTISLSATVSNLDEFADWLRSVRGDTALVVEWKRPVPLQHRVAAQERETRDIHIEPLLAGTRLAPEAKRFRDDRGRGRPSQGGQRRGRQRRGGRGDRASDRGARGQSRGGRERRPPRRWGPPHRTQLVRRLVSDDLGPVIWFIFSRAGCDEAVDQCLHDGLSFVDETTSRRLGEILDDCTGDIDDDTWFGLELDHWQQAFERGIAAHHAGLIPAVKQAVELAFAEGLISAVFATETLALGVNLPARTVVLERLIKYDGQDHKPLTPMEFTQLTGRAGRRGLDAEGTAISCWNTRLGVDDMAKLAASTEYPLRSAFAPNYNMVANLIDRADPDSARRFVARSFAQFQIDRGAVQGETRHLDLERQLAAARRHAECERGSIDDWLAARGRDRLASDDDLGGLRPGSVLAARGGAIVLSVAHRGGGVVVRMATATGDQISVRAGEIAAPLHPLGVASLPAGLGPNDPAVLDWARDELASNWKLDELAEPGVGGCPDLDRHLSARSEAALIEARLDRDLAHAARRRGRLEARFDAVAEILHRNNFADDWQLTTSGNLLTAVHGDGEIVLAEALADGVFDHLDPPEFAAVISSMTYEARRLERVSFRWPSASVRHAVGHLRRRADAYRAMELHAIDDTLTREPDPAMVAIVHGWATGKPIDAILPESMTGGDFVRTMRRVIDLCRQIAATSTRAGAVAGEAIMCLDHGIVRNRRDLAIATDDEPHDQPVAESLAVHDQD